MKIGNRIALGYAATIALMIGLFIYQMITLRQMQSVVRLNSGSNLKTALDSLQLMRDRDSVEDYTRKYFSKPVVELQDQLKSAQESFEKSLAGLGATAPSARVQLEAARMAQFWKEFLESLAKFQPPPRDPDRRQRPQAQTSFPPDLEEHFERLRAQAYSVYQAAVQETSSKAEASGKVGEKAELMLWIWAATAIAVALCVSALIVRSVSAPLRQLSDGTRALAEGKEFYRLDTSRNDELSQIARDINSLTRRLSPERAKTNDD